jgi:threonine 3-dehydrogenase
MFETWYKMVAMLQSGLDLSAVVTHRFHIDQFQQGFDVGLEMSGVPQAFTGMLEHMNHGGKVAMLGIPPQSMAIDWNQVIFKGLEIKGVYGREMFETWYKMVAMLQSGLDLSPMITHRYPVDDFEAAFATMLSGASGKVVLDWAGAS